MVRGLERHPGMKRKRFGALLICLTAFLAAAPAHAQDNQTLVRVDEVRVEPLAQKVPVLGRLVARQRGEVAARINGPVEEFFVEVGDRVEAGQIIASLNVSLLEAKRNLAEAELNKAQAALETAAAELRLSRLELKRLEGLRKSAAFNQARFDDAQQNVSISKSRVDEARATVTSSRVDLDMEDINLSYARILAPYAGVITQRMTEAGAYVQTGAPVVRMVSDQALEIEADVPFQRLSGLEPGIEVGIVLDDGTAHVAKVRALVPEENPLTRTRAVRFVPRIGDTERPLAARQSVTVYVPVGEPRDVVTVHKDAVIKRGPTSLVYVAKGDTAEMRTVTLGEPTGTRFEVLHGLEAGEQVVVRGNERLRPGAKIRIDESS